MFSVKRKTFYAQDNAVQLQMLTKEQLLYSHVFVYRSRTLVQTNKIYPAHVSVCYNVRFRGSWNCMSVLSPWTYVIQDTKNCFFILDNETSALLMTPLLVEEYVLTTVLFTGNETRSRLPGVCYPVIPAPAVFSYLQNTQNTEHIVFSLKALHDTQSTPTAAHKHKHVHKMMQLTHASMHLSYACKQACSNLEQTPLLRVCALLVKLLHARIHQLLLSRT
jgi:hypothetical protein